MFDQLLFPTEQNSKMSEDSNTWPEAISVLLTRKYPELAPYVNKIIFQKVEKVRGYAVGYILMQGDNFRIPFIIDKFILQPLDVYIKGLRYGYLNRRISQRLISASWPFKQLSTNDHAEFFSKTASCVEYVGLSVDDINGNPALLKYAEYLSEKMPEVVVELGEVLIRNERMEKTASESTNASICAIDRNHDRTGFNLVKLGAIDDVVTFKQAVEKFGYGLIKRATEGPVFLGIQKRAESSTTDSLEEQFNFDTQYPKSANMSDGAIGSVRGNIYELRNIKDPEGKLGHIFLSTRKTHPIYQIVGRETLRHNFLSCPDSQGMLGETIDDLNRPSMDKGAMGVMIHNVIFGPFEITNKAVMNGESVYSIREGYEYDKLQLHVSKSVKQILVDGDVIYVPETAKIIWLGDPNVTSISKPIEKRATIWVKLIASPDKSTFSIIDNGVTGIPPAGLQGLRKTKAIAALMSAGLSQEEAKIAIQKSLTDGTYSFQATPTATKTEAQTRAEVLPPLKKTAEIIIKMIDDSSIIKIAADSGDRHTVDLALGLRMITPESVRRFKLLVPKVDDTIDGLCKLLLAKRLGGDVVPMDEKKLETSVSVLSDIGYELTGV